jgi:hypothetical protein
MIKIFRPIRKTLINEGKLKSYLLYGLGEIILVVIGILIAVQLNNLNNKRIEKNEEIRIINSIKSDLEGNINEIQKAIDYNQNTIDEYRRIEKYVLNDLDYDKELDESFGYLKLWQSPYLKATTYNSIKSKGVDLISNQLLQAKISELYDIQLADLINDYDRSEWNFNQNVVNPFFVKHFRFNVEKSLTEASPNNFQELKRSDEFLNILSVLMRIRMKGIEKCEKSIISTRKLISDIESEY